MANRCRVSLVFRVASSIKAKESTSSTDLKCPLSSCSRSKRSVSLLISTVMPSPYANVLLSANEKAGRDLPAAARYSGASEPVNRLDPAEPRVFVLSRRKAHGLSDDRGQ